MLFLSVVLSTILIAWRLSFSGQEAVGTKAAPTDIEILDAFVSPDAFVRDDMAQRIRAHRKMILSAMIRFIDQNAGNPERKEAVTTAIILLGHLRAPEAIPFLVDKITFGHKSGEDVVYSGRYDGIAAVFSLAQIGLPALDPLVQRVCETDDEVIHERAAIVMHHVLGPSFAQLYVNDRRDRESEELRRQRLGHVQSQLERIKRRGIPPMCSMKPPPVAKSPTE